MEDTDFKKNINYILQQDCINKILFRTALLIINLSRVNLNLKVRSILSFFNANSALPLVWF